MTDNDSLDEDDNEKTGKKKGGKTEGDAQSQSAVSVSEGFYSYMAGIGASPTLIASVLRSWSHLRGAGLMRAISDFIKGASTRATAHIQVKIDEGRTFTLLHDVVKLFTSSSKAPTQTQRMDRTNRPNRFDPK